MLQKKLPSEIFAFSVTLTEVDVTWLVAAKVPKRLHKQKQNYCKWYVEHANRKGDGVLLKTLNKTSVYLSYLYPQKMGQTR